MLKDKEVKFLLVITLILGLLLALVILASGYLMNNLQSLQNERDYFLELYRYEKINNGVEANTLNEYKQIILDLEREIEELRNPTEWEIIIEWIKPEIW